MIPHASSVVRRNTIFDLFFESCMATNVWSVISELLGQKLGDNFESIARFWIANRRHKLINIVSFAVLWSIWKLRNEIYFQGVMWSGIQSVDVGCQDAEAIDNVVQTRHWTTSGGFCKKTRDQGRLAISTAVEEGTESSSRSEPLGARQSVSIDVALVRPDESHNVVERLDTMSQLLA